MGVIGSKLTTHSQLGLAPWFPDLVASGIKVHKVMDPGEQDPCPGVWTIARFYIRDDIENAMVWKGTAGADEWVAIQLPKILARRWLWGVELTNEPNPVSCLLYTSPSPRD